MKKGRVKRWVARGLIVSGCGWLVLLAFSTKFELSWDASRRFFMIFSGGIAHAHFGFVYMAFEGQEFGAGSQAFTFSWWPSDGGCFGDWSTIRLIRFPLWLPALLCLIPGLWLWRKDRKPTKGHCQSCGYNLKGLTEPRCPECGTEFDLEVGA